jgi:prepilin-type processing-associated H-X9-DG protein
MTRLRSHGFLLSLGLVAPFLALAIGLTGCKDTERPAAKDDSSPDPISVAQRNETANNLHRLGIAFHNYRDQHKHFPPAAIYDKDGKPLLSWRVLLLPNLEEDTLSGEFHLEEPWDSEHNKKLLAKMPKVFAPLAKPAGPGETYIQGLFGKDAFFDPARKKGVTLNDVTDGLSQTLVLVESPSAVPWTKPEDLPFDADKPLPKIGGHFPDGFHALFADGHVVLLPDKIDPVILKRLITRNERIAPNQGIPPEKQVDY